MSKVFNFYSKNKDGVDTDFAWYDSSNVKYSECEDPNNELKRLKVVFNNGTSYMYKDVDSAKYLLFREDLSQGKALNKYIKGNYDYEKLDNVDIDALDKELSFRMNGGMFVIYKTNEHKLIVKDSKDAILLEKEVKFTQETFDTMCNVLKAVGKKLCVDVDYPIEEGENDGE